MTCKDCIHYDICVFHTKGNENEKCAHFKNKAEIKKLNGQVEHLIGYVKTLKAEAVKEFAEEVKTEIKEALESNYKARQERIDKWRDPNAYIGGEFVSICEGKIAALRGIDDFIDNLLKEMEGDQNA